jgi:hypothetical protein
MNEYDTNHLHEILYDDLGDWFNAELLRFLDFAIGHGDTNNRKIIFKAWPEQCVALLKYYGWTDAQVKAEFVLYGN